jgi:hypothetical protein
VTAPYETIPRDERWLAVYEEANFTKLEVISLIQKGAGFLTEQLMARFFETSNRDAKARILTMLSCLGERETVADLYLKILTQSNERRLNFWAAFEGGMPWFEGNEALRDAIAFHLNGVSTAMERWIRDAFSDGVCRLRR